MTTSEGTATITVEEYYRLKECERAIREDRVIAYGAGSGWASYYIPKSDEPLNALKDELDGQKERTDYWRKECEKARAAAKWYQFWK